MNSDEMQGAWKQMRGKMKQAWGKLTDDDFDRIEGKWDELAGLVQSRYGSQREEAEEEVKRFREEHDVALPRNLT